MQHRGAVAEHPAIPKLGLAWIGAGICAMAMALMLLPAIARDNGQWENSDPMISEWFRGLKQPDRPTLSCCGVADAYWADGLEVKDGQVIAIITDTRPDEPLRRPHVAVGTRVIVPPNKLKWDDGNPTGHIVIFLNVGADDVKVYCYVTNTGI